MAPALAAILVLAAIIVGAKVLEWFCHWYVHDVERKRRQGQPPQDDDPSHGPPWYPDI